MGYIAELPVMLRVVAVDTAGTVVEIAARAGAIDVAVKNLGSQDLHAALRRAEAAAIADARDHAPERITALGPIAVWQLSGD
ncbi:hypothetical protein KZX46_02700 (plasmid) [Polymorphobacter sp. PAMC 29334]|uniref:hypothetical protein n=1 Tax=Polymorphobacter sp. PAMC 29334 TaxID=2862331 RepID=UPI001C765FD9|nr:hypothetical protein [Polymorphobacter sp. PAMC 29334]QYE33055.1 hypothetical protein KZX46_02700 [Polymorphobacter sp. PAMC 29334]